MTTTSSHGSEAATAKHIGIFLFDGVEELDAIGPWEVLSWWTRGYPEDGYTVSCFSTDGQPVQCNKGLVVQPHHSRETVPEIDILLHPGGDTRALAGDDEHLDWLRELRLKASLLTSVCTGSLVYAAAGLLRDRPATTYWGALQGLTEKDPTIDVKPDARWVDDGDVITAAGVSAGIDMALHLVERLASTERAKDVRRGIQYDPEPPV